MGKSGVTASGRKLRTARGVWRMIRSWRDLSVAKALRRTGEWSKDVRTNASNSEEGPR